jgi:hypothetical protein
MASSAGLRTLDRRYIEASFVEDATQGGTNHRLIVDDQNVCLGVIYGGLWRSVEPDERNTGGVLQGPDIARLDANGMRPVMYEQPIAARVQETPPAKYR